MVVFVFCVKGYWIYIWGLYHSYFLLKSVFVLHLVIEPVVKLVRTLAFKFPVVTDFYSGNVCLF